MKELIVAGYAAPHVAFLVRAALSRQQENLSLLGNEVAVVSRESKGSVTVRESITINCEAARKTGFWEKFTGMLFSSCGEHREYAALAEQLPSIGIDRQDQARIVEALPEGGAAILLLANSEARNKISGTLSGFGGTLLQIRLTQENPEQWLREISEKSNE